MELTTARKLIAISSLLILAHSAEVLAVDGVIEINQVRAQAGAVTPGDTPGFPVTISRSGSYRLTGNLNVNQQNAIVITADNVSVDLNGFSIIGTTVCSGQGSDISCSPTSFTQGVRSSNNNTTVRNGAVSGMGNSGVSLRGQNNIVENIHATSNGGDGIFAGQTCVVTHSTAARNGGDGIETGDYCTIDNNSANNNDESGISTGSACTVTNNSVSENDEGVLGRGGVTLIGNTAHENTSYGFLLNSIAGYKNNVLTANNGNGFGSNANPEVSGGIQIGQNLCGSDTVCP